MSNGNISFALTSEQKAGIKLKIDGLKTDMPFLVNLTVDETKRLRKIGPHRQGYATEINVSSNAHPDALAKDFKLAEYNTDKISLSD